MRRLGYRVEIPDGLFRRNGYLAGTDAERARLFLDLWKDPEIKAVFCVRGGYGAMRILGLLDPALIRATPKIFMGFSDLTAILVHLAQNCGVAALHGPVLTALSCCADPEAEISAIRSALNPEAPLSISPPRPLILHPGRAEGQVIGGNLTILTHLIGTPFAPRLTGRILFIEDCREAPYRVDRMLTHMRLAGTLDGLSGVAVGTFDGCGAEDGVMAVIREAFLRDGIPVLAGFDSGHGPRNRAFPMGIEAELDTERGVLEYLSPATLRLETGGPT